MCIRLFPDQRSKCSAVLCIATDTAGEALHYIIHATCQYLKIKYLCWLNKHITHGH